MGQNGGGGRGAVTDDLIDAPVRWFIDMCTKYVSQCVLEDVIGEGTTGTRNLPHDELEAAEGGRATGTLTFGHLVPPPCLISRRAAHIHHGTSC